MYSHFCLKFCPYKAIIEKYSIEKQLKKGVKDKMPFLNTIKEENESKSHINSY